MKTAAVDIGNSRIKIGLFTNSSLGRVLVVDEITLKEVQTIISYGVEAVIVSSVRGDESCWDILNSYFEKIIIMSSSLNLPIEIQYRSKDRLGLDRIAAVVGGSVRLPKQNILIVDAGTAITYDFITEDGVFIGGNIAPGLSMRFESLHHFTKKLPKLSSDPDDFEVVGDSTESAIIRGVQFGISSEIEAYYNFFYDKYGEIGIILTGGDGKLFEKRVKNVIFADINLVLIGLDAILYSNLD